MATPLVSRLKKIVDKYEELLDKTKYISKNIIYAKKINEIHELLSEIETINNEIHISMAKNINELDDISGTLVSYLLTVSLPYERDLLKDIIDNAEQILDNDIKIKIKNTINYIDFLINEYNHYVIDQ